MNLTQCSWWRFPDVKTVCNRFEPFILEGVPVYEIDGREEWLLLSDGSALFEVVGTKIIFQNSDTTVFKEMVEYLHQEDWVDYVLHEMEDQFYQMVWEGDVVETEDTPDICDAYEWLPLALPDTYAKVFPSKETIKKLATAYFTKPQ